MISRYSQIRQQVKKLSELLRAPAHIQKIYSSAWYLCLQLRLPGKTFYLYLGRGGGHEGIWIEEVPIPSILRLRDTWLEWCRKNLTSSLLNDVELDPQDRAIRLRFGHGGRAKDLYLLWAGRSSYFAFNDVSTGDWFIPWGGESSEGFKVFDQVGRTQSARLEESDVPLASIGELLELEKKQLEKLQNPKTKIKSLKRKIEKIQIDLTKIRSWSRFQDWISKQNPEELEGLVEIKFEDLRYKLPVGLSGWQRRDWLFQQAKRLKLAESNQAERLKQTEIELESKLVKASVGANTIKPIRPVWGNVSPLKNKIEKLEDDYDVHSYEGYKIGVGKTAQGNDQLRKSWSKPEDWWIHAASGTSAHAIIKLAVPGQVTPEQIKSSAFLIAKYSGSTASQLEVVLTQVKNVRGVPGKAGMVTYKKSKTLLCDLEEGNFS